MYRFKQILKTKGCESGTGGRHLSPRFRSRLTGLLLFLSLLSYPLSILWISLGGGGGGGGRSAPPLTPPVLPLPPPGPSPPALWLLEVVGRVQEEPGLTDLTSSWAGKEASAPSEAGALQSSCREAPSGLYPACLRLSRLKMLSMLSTSLRGLHAGRHLPDPAPPEQLDLDSLLVLSASQSWSLLEEEQEAAVLAGRWWLMVEEVISERTAAGKEEEEEEERGRLWMMLLMVSLKSRRRLVDEDEKEEEGLGR